MAEIASWFIAENYMLKFNRFEIQKGILSYTRDE